MNLALEQATIEYDQTEVGIKDLNEKIEAWLFGTDGQG